MKHRRLRQHTRGVWPVHFHAPCRSDCVFCVFRRRFVSAHAHPDPTYKQGGHNINYPDDHHGIHHTVLPHQMEGACNLNIHSALLSLALSNPMHSLLIASFVARCHRSSPR